MHAMKCSNAVSPFLRDGLPADPVYLITRAARIIGSHFKAGRENNAVDFVCFTVQHNALGVDFIDAAPACIDKRDIGAVEGLQIFIVKTRAFAELAIIGLERLGCITISTSWSTGTDRFHFAKISQFHFFFKCMCRMAFSVRYFFAPLR